MKTLTCAWCAEEVPTFARICPYCEQNVAGPDTLVDADPQVRTGKEDPAYAWTVALMPLALGVVVLAAPQAVEGTAFFAGFYLVALLLCVLDGRSLAAKGIQGPSMVNALVIPLYLIERTRCVGSTAAIPIVWFATMAATIFAASLA